MKRVLTAIENAGGSIWFCGYMTPKPLLMMIGISMGGVSAAIASGTLSVLRPLVEP
mgnify:CR=1 FL=1